MPEINDFLGRMQREEQQRREGMEKAMEKASEEIYKAKAEEIQRQKDQTQYLKEIRDNTDVIVDQFHQSVLKLKDIDNTLAIIGKDFGDFSELSQIKNMTSEIYEELAKTNLSKEKERLDVVQRLLKRDLGLPLASVLQEILSILLDYYRNDN